MKHYDPSFSYHRVVLADALLGLMREAGFTEKTSFAGRYAPKEKVFTRAFDPDPRISILVYTTIEGDMVRREGKDAIRVCVVFTDRDGKERGIGKERRVNRTGTFENIIARTIVRMRRAWTHADWGITPCSDCGAPTFTSKKGKAVCADLCWTRGKTGGSSTSSKPLGRYETKSRDYSSDADDESFLSGPLSVPLSTFFD